MEREEDLFSSLTYDLLSSSPEQLFALDDPQQEISASLFSQLSDAVEFTEEVITKTHQNPSVLIFHDEAKTQQIPIGGRFNKDLIVTFYIKGVNFKNEELEIDSSVFYSGNKKSKSLPKVNTKAYKLYAEVIDANNASQSVCTKCASKFHSMILIRNTKYSNEDSSITLKGSISCSGVPPNCNRILRVRFRITSPPKETALFEETIYIVESTPFTIFHHRRKRDLNPEISTAKKRKDNSENAIVTTSTSSDDIINPHQAMKPFFQPLPLSLKEELGPVALEIVPHMIEIIQSDSEGIRYDKHLLHFSLRCFDSFVKKFGSLISPKVYVHLAEFFCNVCGSHDLNWDVAASFINQESKHIEMLEFYYDKNRSVVQDSFRDIGTVYPSSAHLVQFLWIFLANFENLSQTTYCNCTECIYSHIAFVIRYALKKGIKRQELVEELIKQEIPTRQLKSWHTSLNGLLQRKGIHFNLMLGLSRTPIGRFTRKFFSPREMGNGFRVMVNFHKKILTSIPKLRDLMTVVYTPQVCPLAMSFLEGTADRIEKFTENSQ